MNNPDQWDIPEDRIPFVMRLRPELQALALDNDGRLPSVHKDGQPLIYHTIWGDPLCPECANKVVGNDELPHYCRVNCDGEWECKDCDVLIPALNKPEPSEPWEDD